MLQNTGLEKRRGFRWDRLEAAIGSIIPLVSRSGGIVELGGGGLQPKISNLGLFFWVATPLPPKLREKSHRLERPLVFLLFTF